MMCHEVNLQPSTLLLSASFEPRMKSTRGAFQTVGLIFYGCSLAGLLMVQTSVAVAENERPASGIATPANAPIPKDWHFEPSWRDNGDCGPVSLFVLARLKGLPLTLPDVKKVLPYESTLGCSMADMGRAADTLDFPSSIRFVKPEDLKTLPPPFILHARGSLALGTGHFLVVTGYDPNRRVFLTIDTSFQRSSEFTEDALLVIFSGYVLTPIASGHQAPYTLGVAGCIVLSGILITLMVITPRSSLGLSRPTGRDGGIVPHGNETSAGAV